jgi:hypothetical protein
VIKKFENINASQSAHQGLQACHQTSGLSLGLMLPWPGLQVETKEHKTSTGVIAAIQWVADADVLYHTVGVI